MVRVSLHGCDACRVHGECSESHPLCLLHKVWPVLLLIYVDHMIITRDDVTSIATLKTDLQLMFQMKDIGSLHYIGSEIIEISQGILVSQQKCISDIITQADISNSRTTNTHLQQNL